MGKDQGGALGGTLPPGDNDPVWRCVVLHLLPGRMVVGAGPLLLPDFELMPANNPCQALVGDVGLVPVQEFFLHTDEITAAFTQQRLDVRQPYLVFRCLFPCGTAVVLQNPCYRVPGDMQQPGDGAMALSLDGEFPDRLFLALIYHDVVVRGFAVEDQ